MQFNSLVILVIAATITACSSNSEKEKPEANPKIQATQDSVLTKQPNEEKVTERTNAHIKISSQEDKLLELVWNLAEVQALNNKILKLSKNQRRLSTRISSVPSDDQEYYGISVAEDNGEALATYFEFRVYPNNQIYYYDPINDQELSLDEWRKTGKHTPAD